MSDYYVGEIRIMAGLNQNTAPQDWHLCDGALLPINNYQALYSILGVTYGGDGVTTFAIPDLRSRLCISDGTGPALTPRVVGQKGGAETVALDPSNLPAHNHTLYTAGTDATTPTIGPTVTFANTASSNTMYVNNGVTPAPTQASPIATTIDNMGANQSHKNIMPSLALYYIIATNGLYPQPS
jgi:microcystin-dependent protein